MMIRMDRQPPVRISTRMRRAGITYSAVALLVLALAGCSAPFSESSAPTAPAPSAEPPVSKITPTASSTATPTSTPQPMPTASATPVVETPTPEITPAPAPQPAQPSADCRVPDGWVPHVVQPSDTVYDLANSTNSTIEAIQAANCLADPSLIYDGQVIFVPPSAASVATTEAPAPVATTEAPAPVATTEAPVPIATTEAPAPRPKATKTPTPTATPCGTFSCSDGSLNATKTPTPTPTKAPTPTPTPCGTFSCSDDGFPALDLDPGGPNEPGNQMAFVPCASGLVGTRIETFRRIVEVGVRRYFFACDFPASPASASMTLSNGLTKTLDLLRSLPNPDLHQGAAEAIIDWPALPIYPTGVYTLTVTDSGGNQAQLDFRVDLPEPNKERILTVPLTGPPGTNFEVYYVNFALNITQTFDLYGEDQAAVGVSHHLSHRAHWQIPITEPLAGRDGKGWAHAPLRSDATDKPVAYAIGYNNKEAFTLFWLR